MNYPFTEQDMERAAAEWGCNCGPSAMAFAIQQPLDVARHAIPEFETKRYTSPSMMKLALHSLKFGFMRVMQPSIGKMFYDQPAVVRIQWTGPWTMPGSNGKWAYNYTHWIATW